MLTDIITGLEIEDKMKKQIIRLTESDLHKIIKESVKRVLREDGADWKKAFDDFLDAPDITDSVEGSKRQKAKDNAIRAAFGKDDKARARAIERYFRERESKKMANMTASQRAEYLKYDDLGDEDEDFDAYAAEKASRRIGGGKAPVAPSRSSEETTPVQPKNNPYAGKSPEELEAMLRNMWK